MLVSSCASSCCPSSARSPIPTNASRARAKSWGSYSACRAPGSSFALLRSELEHFARASDSLVHHDYLAETNESVALTTFVEHLARHGLEYVSDAATLDRSPFSEHPLVSAEAVHGSELEGLAYVDRREMRHFRQAVVRKKRDPAPRFDLARAARLWFASSAEPAARGAVQGTEPVRFKTVAGLELETNVPDAKLALYELGRVWPQALGWTISPNALRSGSARRQAAKNSRSSCSTPAPASPRARSSARPPACALRRRYPRRRRSRVSKRAAVSRSRTCIMSR